MYFDKNQCFYYNCVFIFITLSLFYFLATHPPGSSTKEKTGKFKVRLIRVTLKMLSLQEYVA